MAITIYQPITDRYKKRVVVRVNGKTPAELRREFEQRRAEDMYWGTSGFDEGNDND